MLQATASGGETLVANPYKTWKDVNDTLTVKKPVSAPDSLGILSFGVPDQNSDKIHGSVINGAEPDFETIADDSYPLSRPLHLYVKKAHVDVVRA
jgi:phosphate transport system substrate-binding protein